MSLDTQVVDLVEAACEQWDDNRVMHGDDVVNLVLFLGYGPKVLSQNGLRYRGFQCRQRDDAWLMSVKVTEDGVPLVGFWTGQTPTACISMFLGHLADDRVKWTRDKYPWI